jgi:hypothetical protein
MGAVDLRETGSELSNWIKLAEDKFHWWAFVKLRIP